MHRRSKRLKKTDTSMSTGHVDDEEATTTHDSCAAEKVGTILLIVEKIIANLDFPTLINSRQVTQSWKKLASAEVLRQDVCRVNFNSYRSSNLKKVLENSVDFPCSDFSFSFGDLSDPATQELFSFYGQRIKSLTLNRVDQTDTTFPNLLRHQAPNIEKLTLDRYLRWSEWKETPSSSSLPLPPLVLTSLKTLTFLEDDEARDLSISVRSIGHKVVMSSPNLEIVENLWIRGVDASFWKEKIHLVKKFNFNQNNLLIEDVEKFALASPKLKSISIKPFSGRPHGETLHRILRSSSESLQELESSSSFYLPHPKLTRFDNLHTLRLRIDEDFNLDYYFDEGHLMTVDPDEDDALQSILPRLQTVSFALALKKNDVWGEFVSLVKNSHNQFNSVRNLEVCGIFNEDQKQYFNWEINFSSGWLQRVKHLFPKVKNLLMKDSTKLNTTLPEVFKRFSKLESIRLGVNISHYDDDDGDDYQRTFPNFDSALTGLPTELCRRLARSKILGSIEENYVKLRTGSFLCSLKDLKKFEIFFNDKDYYWAGCTDELPISKISCLYAFKLLSDLRVTIRYNQSHTTSCQLKRLLEPLVPYVTLAHGRNFVYR